MTVPDTLRALLLATQGLLRDKLSLDAARCSVRDDGMPPAKCGEYFYAIHGVAVLPGPTRHNRALDIEHHLRVTVTVRIGNTPADLWQKPAYLSVDTALQARLWAVVAAMSKYRYTDGAGLGVLEAANTTLGDDHIIEPLEWVGSSGSPKVVGPEWFTAQSPDTSAGLVGSADFRGGRAIVKLEDL